MKDSSRVIATRELLLQQGDKPEEVEAILNVIRAQENTEKNDSLRSWLAIVISGLAMVVSFVAIFK
ncbi:MAG: hypothetical protein WC719_00035 [Patescibacteria group bacterium]|jgi:hypothetical protein